MSTPERALRGLLANPRAGLALVFQFNPTSVEFSKSTNYSVTSIPGWDHPDVLFESGGPKRIKFDLVFDNSAASKSFRTLGNVQLIGVEAFRSIIESFQNPIREGFSAAAIAGTQPRWQAPPKGILVLGSRFYQVILDGEVTTRDALFDTMLTPLRLYTSLDFLVLEEGAIHEFNVAKRNALAKIESALAPISLVLEKFSGS